MTTARGGRSYLGHSRQWMVPVLLFVLALPAITPRLYASDEVGYFANLRSLWFDHDVSFDNEYRYFYDRGIAVAWTFYESYLVRETATGLRYSYWTVGPAILWSPFYAVADVTTRIRRAFGSEVPADGYSRPYLRAVTLGSAFYGFLAICLAIVTARRLVGEAHPAGLAIWLGTPLLHYMYIAPGFSHACSAFAAALFVAVWLRVRETWSLGGLMGLGAVCALMVMVREQAVFFVVGPAIDYLWSVAGAARAADWARVRTLVVRVAAGAAVSLLCYSPQLLIYQTLYGQFTTPYTLDDRMLWHAPHFSTSSSTRTTASSSGRRWPSWRSAGSPGSPGRAMAGATPGRGGSASACWPCSRRRPTSRAPSCGGSCRERSASVASSGRRSSW